ncbi:hypothetical protein FRC12_009338 [Ceratobasidium sp. 428]|nr:hypothetical protein FRC12_009338 [Ceratobasidium sp. 428]
MSTVSGDVRPPGDGNNARLAANELRDSDAASTVGSTKKYGTSADTANEWANTRSYVDQIPVLLLVGGSARVVEV